MLILRCTGRLAYTLLRLVRKAENRIHDVGSCYVVTLFFVNALIASTFSTPSGHEPDASNLIKFQLILPQTNRRSVYHTSSSLRLSDAMRAVSLMITVVQL